jgi:pimeloyl-ACP methyl ester carboxylesterase
MWPLARRLERAGFRTRRFGYPTRGSLPAQADRLDAFVNDSLAAHAAHHDGKATALHFVAHSLGGLLLAHLYARHPTWRPHDGRVVLLGTPLRGSGVAGQLARWRLGRWLLGGALNAGLLGDAPALPPGPTLLIAGSRAIGPGRLVPGGLSGPSDGTVAIDETRSPALTAHRILPVNHFGMLVSRQVADETIAFLREGPDDVA